MRRLRVVVSVGAIVASLMLAEPALASLATDNLKAALLTSAQAKRVSGTSDPLTDSESWCASPAKGTGVVTCSRSWTEDADGAIVIPTETRIDQYPTPAAATRAFHAVVRAELAEAANVGVDPKVVVSTSSTVLFTAGVPVPFIAVGYQRVGRILISVSCETTDESTAPGITECTRRMLTAQAAKAKSLGGCPYVVRQAAAGWTGV